MIKKLTLIIFLFSLLIGCQEVRYPKKLSGHTETIEVMYINWACDCPDFIETRYYADSCYEATGEECIYIEAARPDLRLSDHFYAHSNYSGKCLRLTGQFYLDKGVSRTYEEKASGKMDNAKVFRYDSIEIVDVNISENDRLEN